MGPQNSDRSRQPVPAVTAEDVARIVRRDFPPQQFDSVIELLAEYGKESWHREPLRVRLAVLKLANGNVHELRRHVEMARRDYRDVLAYAEYPNYMQKVPVPERLPGPTRERIVEQDWRQYQDWLKKT